MNIEELLNLAKNSNASDLHISTGAPAILRIDGDMTIANVNDKKPLSENQVSDLLKMVMNDEQKQNFKKNLEIDFSIQFAGKARFRVNAFHNIHGPAATFREIPLQIKDLDQLGLPPVMKNLTSALKGLILVVGPTGSGKSTTLAAFVDHINNNRKSHIITIEDPVEFTHQNKQSLINQREVGSNTKSFANALKSSLREDPDVILVGEMRDVETIKLALTAAETGHLVLATLHTSSAAQTINRVIDVFPSHDKAMARSMLSTSLKAVVSQRLIKKVAGGRCAAYEIMIANSSIRNLIREDKIPQINSIIELNKKAGMCQMKDSVDNLLQQGIISMQDAKEILLFNE
jgi:twitching motility protein PilT